jgi:hypothetical protein
VGRGENQILGGSDPALCGLPAAQRLRRRGSLPPKVPSRIPRSVAGRVGGRKPNNLESLTAQEMKRWLGFGRTQAGKEGSFGSPRRGSAHDASAVCGFPRGATHEYIIGESLKRLFRRDKEFNLWLEKNHRGSTAASDTSQPTSPTPKNPMDGAQSFRCASDFLVLAISSASFFSSGKASLYSLDRTLLRRFPNA